MCPGRRVGFARGLKRAKATAEGDLPLVIEALVVEHQHGMVLEGREDLGEGPVVHRLADVDAADLGTKQRMQLSDRDRH